MQTVRKESGALTNTIDGLGCASESKPPQYDLVQLDRIRLGLQ